MRYTNKPSGVNTEYSLVHTKIFERDTIVTINDVNTFVKHKMSYSNYDFTGNEFSKYI